MNPVAWKAYDEVNFNDQYILRWVREGDMYVNNITKEMMEDLKEVVCQLQAEIDAVRRMNVEQEILNAFERGKGVGIAEGMKMMRLKELTNDEITPSGQLKTSGSTTLTR